MCEIVNWGYKKSNRGSRPVIFSDSEESVPWEDLKVNFDDGSNLKCSRCLLGMVSPAFRATLYGNFSETSKKEIRIAKVEREEFQTFIHHISPQTRMPVTRKVLFFFPVLVFLVTMGSVA